MDRGPGRGVTNLTSRECDVLDLLSDGLSNKQIARALGISLNTVRSHLHTSYLKLGARNRTEAAVRYLNSRADD
jgi:DNA-binding NarL/FixJ family response regulator